MSVTSLKLNPDLVGRVSQNTVTVREFNELRSEGLIGEQSGALQETNSRNSYDDPIVQQEKLRFWSERTNTQWWAMMEDGAVGQQAAAYLAQMTTEKRQTAADYLASFHDLSNALQADLSDVSGSADLDQLLDNVAAGRSPTLNADGSNVEFAEQIEQFWQSHQTEISDVETQYNNLKAFPQHLSEWLDSKQIERSAEVDAMVEKHRYSGLNGLREHSDALLGSFRFNIRDDEGAQMMVPGELGSISQKDNFSMFDSLVFSFPVHEDYTKRAIQMALMMGDAGAMKNALATGMMQQEQQSQLAKYSNIYGTLSANIQGQMQGIEPSISLQEILDNLAAGKDPAMLPGDSLHPDADKIRDVTAKFAGLINAVQTQQQQFESAPKTVKEWLAEGKNSQMLDQMVYNQFSLEPWESGSNSRMFRDSASAPGLNFFIHQGEEYQQKIIDEAVERRDRLEKELFRYTGGDSALDLETVLHNFRFNLPLGLMKNGEIHDASYSLKAFIEDNMDDIANHIDWSWVLGEQENLTMIDYSQWMGYDRAEKIAEPVVDWLLESFRKKLV
ncbi:hypothetical protein [Marinomonas fungiae]|uniref:Uncharacterized protein n=1 Tax=Marinomonas fungiae TaxID=1137284 RepID=A0A0K6IL40_9GAMM|nr:hypothetical protein [Marinomonas fungiae]CUB03825.1 hypothetical protein Ga0061065_104256 [Marinomonas fungiae]